MLPEPVLSSDGFEFLIFKRLIPLNIDPVAMERGRVDAVRDIAADQPRLFWGTRGQWGIRFTAIMKQRFNVEVIHLDCFTTVEQSSFERGYNETIKTFLAATFGDDAFANVKEEIRQFRSEQYRQWLAASGNQG
jgi:hypothetical protein